jgi:hypothetical protein
MICASTFIGSQLTPLHPRKPRLVLRVGITGHRPNKLNGAAVGRIEKELPLFIRGDRLRVFERAANGALDRSDLRGKLKSILLERFIWADALALPPPSPLRPAARGRRDWTISTGPRSRLQCEPISYRADTSMECAPGAGQVEVSDLTG